MIDNENNDDDDDGSLFTSVAILFLRYDFLHVVAGMFAAGFVVGAGFVVIIRYYRLDTYVIGLLSLVDLLLTVKKHARRVQSSKNSELWTMADTIEESCRKNWDRVFVELAGENTDKGATTTMTYGDTEMASSAVAKWITTGDDGRKPKLRCRPNDKVAIFMPSSCEYIATLFGLIRCGVSAALVNTELRGNSLVHALTTALQADEVEMKEGEATPVTAGAAPPIKAVVVSPELKHILESLIETGQLPSSVNIVQCGLGCDLDPFVETKRFAYIRQKDKASRWDDTCLYIYTSGTTGFPKASKMNHMRIWSGGCVGAKICRLKIMDRLYCPLPLFHSSGLTLGLFACLQRGCTIVVRPKFSVRNFSHDVLTHNCTGVQYIGEMARYLVSAPTNVLDSKIKTLRFAWGNGMAKEVWEAFQRRYNIPLVNEFYASTEGNVNIFNNTGRAPGACGIVPPGCGFIYPIGIFKYDPDTGGLIRDERTGLCVPCSVNEPGELLGLIKQNDPSRRFDGYTDDDATERKIVSNVCKLGDKYFRSGDLLRRDRWGFFYFCDRVGETFRWKGENVSTSEVARILLSASTNVDDGTAVDAADENPIFVEAVVYGVEVDGHPGRAGMATAVLSDSTRKNSGNNNGSDNATKTWQTSLWLSLQLELPRYAQPLFIRIANNNTIEKTSTQKYKKKKLQDESFLYCGTDKVYLRDDSIKSFVLMDDSIKADVLKGKRRI